MPTTVRTVAATLAAIVFGVVTAFTSGRQAPAPSRDLMNPAAFSETAPATFQARFDGSAGAFTVLVTRSWAPNSADRFYNLVKAGFYNECRFFRVVQDVGTQFGIHGDPAVQAAWAKATIPADHGKMTNTRGRAAFALAPVSGTRSTQVFISFGDNSKKLDSLGLAPFGQVTVGMVMVERVFSRYGEGPDPKKFLAEGNVFLARSLPALDYIKTATIVEAPRSPIGNR
jgi:peptidyl-prolyl cis-trans isomerase A (cyclophilin A)